MLFEGQFTVHYNVFYIKIASSDADIKPNVLYYN